MISTRNAKNIIPRNNRNPWSWIPTLYFAEGLPYVAVMTIAVIMYKRLGLSNTEIALYTSWLYLPWTIKPLWSRDKKGNTGETGSNQTLHGNNPGTLCLDQIYERTP